jgi:hypothetical protein
VPDRQELIGPLEEAYAGEAALLELLSGHLAVAPRSEYRDLLERSVAVTRLQGLELRERLSELGAGPSRLKAAAGVARRAVAAARSPLGLGRATADAERQLRNARDAWAPVALLATTYAALEASAAELGDDSTAGIAEGHREVKERERLLGELHEVIAVLAQDVAAAIEETPVPAGGRPAGAGDVAARVQAAAREAAAAVRAATGGER